MVLLFLLELLFDVIENDFDFDAGNVDVVDDFLVTDLVTLQYGFSVDILVMIMMFVVVVMMMMMMMMMMITMINKEKSYIRFKQQPMERERERVKLNSQPFIK